MKWILLLLTSVSLIVNTHGIGSSAVPFQLEIFQCNHDRSLDLDVSDTLVYFYDFPKDKVQNFPIKNAAKGILAYENLDPVKQFIIFVEGFKSYINNDISQHIRDKFKPFPNSYLIITDHSAYTNSQLDDKSGYERAVKYVYYIGKAIGNFLTDLTHGGISPKNMHCIGHSLGAQMLVHTGDMFLNNTGHKIERITGLDSARPCFDNSPTQEQLRSGVAEYVDAYHCNAGVLGTTSVLADADFFANNGQTQPNCDNPFIPDILESVTAAKCSHNACITIYTATVQHPDWYQARRCNSYKEFNNGSCASNEIANAGFWSPGNTTGVFYFSTKNFDIPTL